MLSQNLSLCLQVEVFVTFSEFKCNKMSLLLQAPPATATIALIHEVLKIIGSLRCLMHQKKEQITTNTNIITCKIDLTALLLMNVGWASHEVTTNVGITSQNKDTVNTTSSY